MDEIVKAASKITKDEAAPVAEEAQVVDKIVEK